MVSLAAEGIGLTGTERKIIVGEAITPPHQPEEFWGSMPAAALPTARSEAVGYRWRVGPHASRRPLPGWPRSVEPSRAISPRRMVWVGQPVTLHPSYTE